MSKVSHKSLLQKENKGFTIIELMMATMVFSVIMLIAAGTVVRFTNNFQKGITQSTTQGVARGVVDTISQQLQFVGSMSGFRILEAPEGSTSKGYCIHGNKYSYILGKQLEAQAPYVLIEQNNTGDGCGVTAQNLSSGSVSGKEILAPNMRLAKFQVINDADPNDADDGSSNPKLYKVRVKVVYGDDDLLCISGDSSGSARDCSSKTAMTNVSSLGASDLEKLSCKTQIGSQFCAVSDISTTIQNRL